MKFTLSAEGAPRHRASLDEILTTLTRIGLEVESVEDKAAELAAFRVAHVRTATRHPNADKLQVCIVDTGAEDVMVVCGAPNARAGMKAVFAPVGAIIPASGLELKAGSIRGQLPTACCARRELKLGEDHDGIIELPDDAPVGAPVAAVLGLDDPSSTSPSRPIAATATASRGSRAIWRRRGLPCRDAEIAPVAGPIPRRSPPRSRRASGAAVRGAADPRREERAVARLDAEPPARRGAASDFGAGGRDQPHQPRPGAAVACVRRRQAERRPHRALRQDGESLVGLDGKTYALDGGSSSSPTRRRRAGIAGVMGGLETGCTMETVNVFIEAALFDPVRIAAAGRKTGINRRALSLRARRRSGLQPRRAGAGDEADPRVVRRRGIRGGERRRGSRVAADHRLRSGAGEAADRLDLPPAEICAFSAISAARSPGRSRSR